MVESSAGTNAIFETVFDGWLLIRPVESDPSEWQDFDQGPGRFTIPSGFEACVRIRNIDDSVLYLLAEEIARCPAVICLDLSENRKVTDDSLRRIAGLSQIMILNLSSCDLTDRGLVWLEGMKQLQSLNLSYCNRLSEAGLKHLRGLTRLSYLDLKGCPRIKHAGIIKTVARRGLTVHS